MAKVSLRIYNREIETMVDGGQLDEAIAHCRHILNTFPKNLETYRLLGKAYLEARRYTEATDIFERLLMAVPDDFVAHVGMSIINDEQNDMDAAIWHMERAFEVQPSNAAIQSELQRLFGRRDGVEPAKIRLTRGALAHMYVQGELYPQAISEINAVLEEDRDRHDMQVLLAQAYFHAGQKNEAAEMCSQLLRRYPYCFDANRVLVELLPETERGESPQAYRQRVNELDPYATFVTGSVFHSDEVADAAVSLERLDWDGQPVDLGQEWKESLGIGLDDKTAPGDEEPDWLKTDLTTGSFGASTLTDEPASVSSSDDDIPAFLREAGWGKDTGTYKEGPGAIGTSDESTEEPALAEGDLPDWIKAMAPSDAGDADSTSQDVTDEDLTQDDVPDWLQGLGDVQASSPQERTLEQGDLPGWLAAMKPADETPQEPQPQVEEEVVPEPAGDEDLPDWLKPIQPEEEIFTAQEIPGESKPEPPLETPQEPAQELPEMTAEILSDWQLGEEEPAGSVDFDATDTGALGTSADEQDDAIAWLESLAAKHGAKPEELVTDPDARKETAPEWVQKASEAGSAAQVPVDGAASSEEPVEDELEWMQPAQEVEDGEELFAELEESQPKEPLTPAGADETGVWLRDLGEEGGFVSGMETTDEVESAVMGTEEDVPDWLRGMEAESSKADAGAMPEEEEQEVPDWLSELGTEPSKVEDGPPSEAESLPAVPAEEEAPEAETGLTPEGEPQEVPDWLSGIDTEPSKSENLPPVPSEEETVWDPGQEVVNKVDVNTASIEQLAELPGVGWEMAQNIIAYREIHGAFSSVYDLSEVPGIAPSTIDELRERVEFQALEDMAEPGEPDFTDWLKSIEPVDTGTDAEETVIDETVSDDLPSWLAGMEEKDVQPEAPIVGADDDLPEWLRAVEEQEPLQAEPTAPTDWQPVDLEAPVEEEPGDSVPEPEQVMDEPPVQPAPLEPSEPVSKPELEPESQPERQPYQEPVARSRSGMTGMLSSAQEPALTQAQQEMTRGNIPGAIDSYEKLIRRGRMLDEIIFDLREALYQYPVDVSILQTLGDAYMRSNRLQDALDAYTKAEELLR